jgi:hypothetical protein
VKQAGQVLFIHLAETEETCFFTVVYMAYIFFQTVIKVTEQCVRQSFIKVSCVSVPWWMEESHDGIRTQKHSLWLFLCCTNSGTFLDTNNELYLIFR